MATTKAEYVKVGVFVTAAVAAAVGAAIVFGAGSFGREEPLMETYIEESVQGLDVGGSVKFRGIPIGKIQEVTFVWPTYTAPDTPEGHRAMRYARIVFSVDPRCVDENGEITFGDFVQDRLRVSIRNQGITGLRYLNIDYVEGTDRHMLPVPWEPRHQYIPSSPGMTKAIADVVQNISEQLARLDVEKVTRVLKETLETVNTQVRQARIADTASKLNSLVTRLDELAGEFDAWRRSGAPGETLSSVKGTVRSLEQSANAIREALPELLEQTGGIATNLEDITYESRLTVVETLENLRRASLALDALLERLAERPSLLLKDQH